MTDFNQEYIARFVQLSQLPQISQQKCDEIALGIIGAMDQFQHIYAEIEVMTREFVAMAMSQTATIESLEHETRRIQHEFVHILGNFVKNLFESKTVPYEVTKHIFDSVSRPFEGKDQYTMWQETLADLQGNVLVRLLADKPDLALGVWKERVWYNPQDSSEFNVQFIEPFFRSMEPSLRISMIMENIGYYVPSATECLVRSHFLSSYHGTLCDVPMDGWPSEWVVVTCFSVMFERDKNLARLWEILEERVSGDFKFTHFRHVFISEILRLLGILRDSKATIGQLAIAIKGYWRPFGQDHADAVRRSNDRLTKELGNHLRNNSLAKIIIGFI